VSGRGSCAAAWWPLRGAAALRGAPHAVGACEAVLGAADFLSLAAAPTFRLMALLACIFSGDVLHGRAGRLAAQRQGADVPAGERLPFGALAEAAVARLRQEGEGAVRQELIFQDAVGILMRPVVSKYRVLDFMKIDALLAEIFGFKDELKRQIEKAVEDRTGKNKRG